MTHPPMNPRIPHVFAAAMWAYITWLCCLEYIRLVHWAWGAHGVHLAFGPRPTWLLVIAATAIAATAVTLLWPRQFRLAAITVAVLSISAASSFGFPAVVEAWHSQKPDNCLLLNRLPLLSSLLAVASVILESKNVFSRAK